MRDTSVRQSRVPHTWDTLSTDCNVHVTTLPSLLNEGVPDNDLKECVDMFIMFLDGQTYDAIAEVCNRSRHHVRKDITKAYRWFRKEHSCPL